MLTISLVAEDQEKIIGHVVIFFVNNDLRITASNRLFKNKFGKVDDFCYAALMGNDRPCSHCPALQCFDSGTSEQMEVTFKVGSEKDKPYLAWSSPVEDSKGGISDVMIIATDINRIVDIQDHLTSLGLMVGSISHGIKGLLTGLDGGVYVLDSAISKQDDSQAREGLEMVKQMTHKIRKLILDILFYAKERELKKENIQAKSFLDDLVNTVSPRAEKAPKARVWAFLYPTNPSGATTEKSRSTRKNTKEPNLSSHCPKTAAKNPADSIFQILMDCNP